MAQTIDNSVSMKLKIENILDELGVGESRAAKMDINDLLKYVT